MCIVATEDTVIHATVYYASAFMASLYNGFYVYVCMCVWPITLPSYGSVPHVFDMSRNMPNMTTVQWELTAELDAQIHKIFWLATQREGDTCTLEAWLQREDYGKGLDF